MTDESTTTLDQSLSLVELKEKSQAWKAQFNKRAVILNGAGASHAYDEWRKYEGLYAERANQ